MALPSDASRSSGRFLLGIDTSCDDTSVALMETESGNLLVNLVSSQAKLHAPFGGVVPELASRRHAENLPILFSEALSRAGTDVAEIGGVAVTCRPGLIGCLLVGLSFARALAWRLDVPLIPIHHLEAHLFSPFIGNEPEFPFLGLVVSGGHTAFYGVHGWDDIRPAGQTVDDAAGEAFDKVAKLLGLGYPGGPAVEALAQKGDPLAFPFTQPRVKMGEEFLSFSGIKTALARHARNADGGKTAMADLCASFQKTVVDYLVAKARRCLSLGDYRRLAVSGGVAMNGFLRGEFKRLGDETGVRTAITAPEFTTDNAAMVAYLARHRPPAPDIFATDATATSRVEARALFRKARLATPSGRRA